MSFAEVVGAIHFVYNISYPLAILLTLVGFLTCGTFSWRRPSRSSNRHLPTLFSALALFLMSVVMTFFIFPSWTLDLSALSARGAHKITHNASFVHPDDISSTAPDPRMVEHLIHYATQASDRSRRSGLGLVDFARFHAQRERAARAKLFNIHEQVALGEGALTWLVLRGFSESPPAYSGIVPTERVRQWLGEERLPDGWWDPHGVRPARTIGLWTARHVANLVELLMETGI